MQDNEVTISHIVPINFMNRLMMPPKINFMRDIRITTIFFGQILYDNFYSEYVPLFFGTR